VQNLRHNNGTISDMSLVKFKRPKLERVRSDTNHYVTGCKDLYWSNRLGDVRVTNFQEETCSLWSQRPSKCLWYSVVIFCQRLQKFHGNGASVRRRFRSGDRGKRSSAQTVTLRPKQSRMEHLVIEGPSAGGCDGYIQKIGYAIASALLYHVSPAPGWSW
jgi:hypothetical protein